MPGMLIEECQESVVSAISIKGITDCRIMMPFTNRMAWLATQHECPDMRRTCAHLQQGTRPNKKANRVTDVKRYHNVLTVSRDGLLVASEQLHFNPTRERIAVPRGVVSGLLTALHININHPIRYQLKQLFTRYFFALDVDRAISRVYDNCHHCQALKSIPPLFHSQSSEQPPDKLGEHYAADGMRRYCAA